MDRRKYFTTRRSAQIAAGLCTKNKCKSPPVVGLTLCEVHRRKNLQHMAMMNIRRGKRRRNARVQEVLPDERLGFIQKFTVLSEGKDGSIEEIKGYFQTGEYPDGRLGEVFIRVGKPGEEHAMLDQWAMNASVALQYGAPVSKIFGKAINTRFQPFGAVLSVTGVKRCSSILDLVARCVLRRYDVSEEK